MNLQHLAMLGKFKGLRTSDIQASHVLEIAKVLGLNPPSDTVSEIVQLIRSDDEDTLAAWIQKPGHFEKIKVLAENRAQDDGSVIVCPHCDGFIHLSQE